MYAEIKKNHERCKEFLNYVLRVCPDSIVNEYESNIYIDAVGVRIIRFFSSIRHDVVVAEKDKNGELLSFPLEMFGTIWEM